MELPPLGLYVHLPWCERKCPYCDFNSHESAILPEAAYVEALLADLAAQAPLAAGRAVSTLFIGGGTPSLFSAAAIARLLCGIHERLSLAPDLEATMEANPGSAEAEKFAGFRDAGINRLSIGIQSFSDPQLATLGRVHDGNQARRAVRLARRAGFDNINLDLMHGLPSQGAADAAADLTAALEYRPQHLSWYQLTIERNTLFHKRPPALPVEDELAAIQDRGEAALGAAGLAQYEVSAWSLPGRACRHNRNYWEFGDYIGIGAGAHGKITTAEGEVRRLRRHRQPAAYMTRPKEGHSETLRDDELASEYLLNAFRLREGFELAGFEGRTGLDRELLLPRLEAQAARGLVTLDHGRVSATELGWRFLDSVIADHLPG